MCAYPVRGWATVVIAAAVTDAAVGITGSRSTTVEKQRGTRGRGAPEKTRAIELLLMRAFCEQVIRVGGGGKAHCSAEAQLRESPPRHAASTSVQTRSALIGPELLPWAHRQCNKSEDVAICFSSHAGHPDARTMQPIQLNKTRDNQKPRARHSPIRNSHVYTAQISTRIASQRPPCVPLASTHSSSLAERPPPLHRPSIAVLQPPLPHSLPPPPPCPAAPTLSVPLFVLLLDLAAAIDGIHAVPPLRPPSTSIAPRALPATTQR